MKHILLLLLILINITGYAQAKIDMSPVFSFTPASATSPSSTINYSTSVSFIVYVKNNGNAVFNGSIQVMAIRDTTSGIGLDSVSVSGILQPNGIDSLPGVLTFTPSSGPNAFKSAGNGNTIVVWPLITLGTGIEGDSVRPIIWINDPAGIFEFEATLIKIYPNPVSNNITIKTLQTSNYKKITIYDVFARKIKEIPFKEIIDVSELNSGLYWMIIYSENKSYRINFIKE